METWKAIPGWEGIYSVSSLGRIRRDKAMMGTRAGKILKPNAPYHTVTLTDSGRNLCGCVHTLVALAFIGEPPNDLYEINHINGNKLDNRPENLEWVTRSENLKHSYSIGLRSKKGEKHHRNKLTDEDVIRIRKLVANGKKQKEIAEEYGIDQSAVSRVASGKRWGHVERM